MRASEKPEEKDQCLLKCSCPISSGGWKRNDAKCKASKSNSSAEVLPSQTEDEEPGSVVMNFGQAYTFPLLWIRVRGSLPCLPPCWSLVEWPVRKSCLAPPGTLWTLTFYLDSLIIFQASSVFSSQSNHPAAHSDSSGCSGGCSRDISSKPHIQCHPHCHLLLSTPTPSALHCTSVLSLSTELCV